MITIHQSGSNNSNAYNRNEYVISSDLSTLPKFKYLTNILYDITSISNHSPYQLNGLIYTRLDIGNDLFLTGDKVFLSENGIFNILYKESGYIVVDADINDLDIQPSTTVSKVISYKLDKEPTRELGLIDYSNTLKNFCTHKLLDVDGVYWSDEVLKLYKLVFGEEYEFEFEFEDNCLVSGSSGIGFHNSSLSASYTASIPFQVGDQIIIQQNLQEWDYNYSTSSGSYVAFSGSSIHNLKAGQQVYITGQTINPYYNGYSTVISGQDTQLLVIDKNFISGEVVSGSAFGQPLPEYNQVAEITSIYYTSSLGIVIGTDIPVGTSSQPISGKIKFADGTVQQVWQTPTNTKLTSTGKFDKLQQFVYDSELFHLKSGISQSFLASTVLSFNDLSDFRYRVEEETKSWILVKPSVDNNGNYNSASLNISYNFYDITGSLLGTGSFNYSSSINFLKDQLNPTLPNSNYGIYIPVGLQQLSSSLNFTSSLSTYYNDVKEYELRVQNNQASIIPIRMRLNDDCNPQYGKYKLLFKDSMGSWISYPFIYKSIESTETNTKTYYRKEGNWNNINSERDYTTYDRGRTNIYKRYTDKFRLSSGWVEEDENIIIKDLLTSPELFLQDLDGNIRAVQLLNTELEKGKKINTQIFNYTLEVALSTDELRY